MAIIRIIGFIVAFLVLVSMTVSGYIIWKLFHCEEDEEAALTENH